MKRIFTLTAVLFMVFIVLVVVGKMIEIRNIQKTGSSVKTPTKYVLYHLGASWCAPCNKMKQDVWQDEGILALLKRGDIELNLLDSTNDKHSKYYSYYKVRVYPTIIMVVRKKPEQSVFRLHGYKDKESMIKLINHFT